MRLKVQEEFFCLVEDMAASTDPGWIQTTFDILAGLFDHVGMKTNSTKQWGWSTSHAGQSFYGQMKTIPRGLQGQGGDTRRDSGSGLSTLIAGRTWRGGHWMCTAKPSTAW